MEKLVALFLAHGGQPNALNSQNQSCLHAACGGLTPSPKGFWGEVAAALFTWGKPKALGPVQEEQKVGVVATLLGWRGFEIDGVVEQCSVHTVDLSGSTPLHYAAQHGLVACCRCLLAAGAILTLVNNDQATACEIAHVSGHGDLAAALEALTLFDLRLGGSSSSPSEQFTSEEARPLATDFESLSPAQVAAMRTPPGLGRSLGEPFDPAVLAHIFTFCSFDVAEVPGCPS